MSTVETVPPSCYEDVAPAIEIIGPDFRTIFIAVVRGDSHSVPTANFAPAQ
jgi:hypothetical protein